jgi:hypothetical protein
MNPIEKYQQVTKAIEGAKIPYSAAMYVLSVLMDDIEKILQEKPEKLTIIIENIPYLDLDQEA